MQLFSCSIFQNKHWSLPWKFPTVNAKPDHEVKNQKQLQQLQWSQTEVFDDSRSANFSYLLRKHQNNTLQCECIVVFEEGINQYAFWRENTNWAEICMSPSTPSTVGAGLYNFIIKVCERWLVSTMLWQVTEHNCTHLPTGSRKKYKPYSRVCRGHHCAARSLFHLITLAGRYSNIQYCKLALTCDM